MNPFWQTILITATGQGIGLLAAMYLFRWRKQTQVPFDLTKLQQCVDNLAAGLEENKEHVGQLFELANNLRASVKYIEGRLNGRHWKEN